MKKIWLMAESAVLAAADQIMKSYVEQNMEMHEERTLRGKVVLRRVRNKGMCMNILEEKEEIVKGISAAAASGVTAAQIISMAGKGRFLHKQGLAFLSAGAWSNTFDRWGRQGVVDYIGIKSGSEKISSITYNLADLFIFAGSILLMISAVFAPVKRKLLKKEKSVVS